MKSIFGKYRLRIRKESLPALEEGREERDWKEILKYTAAIIAILAILMVVGFFIVSLFYTYVVKPGLI